jgi:hypothetical protein
VTDDPEFPKQNIKIVSLSKPVSVPTTNSVGAENCGTFVANVLQANGIKGIDTQKIYSVFKKPQEQGVAEGEANYDSEWDEKVKRVGQMAKEGPRKTVWDPVKRVYKTVPINAPQDKKPSDQNIAENWEDAMTRAVLKLIESQLK